MAALFSQDDWETAFAITHHLMWMGCSHPSLCRGVGAIPFSQADHMPPNGGAGWVLVAKWAHAQGGRFAAGSPCPAPISSAWRTWESSLRLGACVLSLVAGVGIFHGHKQKLQRPRCSSISITSGHRWPRGWFQMLGGGARSGFAATPKSSLSSWVPSGRSHTPDPSGWTQAEWYHPAPTTGERHTAPPCLTTLHGARTPGWPMHDTDRAEIPQTFQSDSQRSQSLHKFTPHGYSHSV